MPQRSNDFQRMVVEVERQLVPFGAIVEESAMLPERGTGDLREVDILISLDEGQHQVRIGIECQNKSRPASKQWIESIAKKHEELGINKTVLVSSSGFYAAAKRKAESLFISTLDFTNVSDADWPTEVLSDLKVYVRDRSSTITKLGWGLSALAPGVTQEMVSNLTGVVARFPNGKDTDILDVVRHYANSILEQTAEQDEGPAFAVARLHADLHLRRRSRLLGVAQFIYLWWKHSTAIRTIRLKPYRYRGKLLASGTLTRRGIQWTATAIIEQSGIMRIRCAAPGTLKTVLRFTDFKPSEFRKQKKTRNRQARPSMKGSCKIPPFL